MSPDMALIMAQVNWFWQTLPSFDPPTLLGQWPEFLVSIPLTAALGGLWLLVFQSNLAALPTGVESCPTETN